MVKSARCGVWVSGLAGARVGAWCRGVVAMAAVAIAALALPVVCAAQSADDTQTKVVLADLPGRFGAANREAIQAAMVERGGVMVWDQTWWQQRAEAVGVNAEGVLDMPEELVKLARGPEGAAKVDALIAPINATRDVLVLEVYNGATGTPVGTVDVALKWTRVDPKKLPGAVEALAEKLALTGWPEEPKKVEAPPEDTVDPLLEAQLSLEPEPEPEPVWPWLRVSGAGVLIKRDFNLLNTGGALDLSTAFFPGFGVGAEVYPLVPVDPGAWWSGLGVRLAFARGSETIRIREAERTTDVGADYSNVAMDLMLRLTPSDALEAGFGVGGRFIDFVLAENAFYSSTTYRALALSAQTTWRSSVGLELGGGVALVPWASLGDSEAEFGTASTTFGVLAHARARYTVFAGAYLELMYQLQALQTSFEGEGLRGLEDVDASDIFNDVALQLGYQL